MSDLTPDAAAWEAGRRAAAERGSVVSGMAVLVPNLDAGILAAYAADAGLAALLQWCLELEQSAAIHRRDALAFKGERDRLAVHVKQLREALRDCRDNMIRAARTNYTGADDYHEAINAGEAALRALGVPDA